MNRSPLQRSLTEGLALFFKRGNLSPRQIGMVALGIIGLLYTVLITNVDQTASAAPHPAPIQQSGAPTPAATEDSLGNEFLNEYQRLSNAPADANAAEPESAATASGSLGGSLIMAVLLVGGLAYAGIWGYKQITLRQKGTVKMGGTLLSVQETQPIGTNQNLHLVRLGEEMLLIGATDQTITLLARYGAEQFEGSFDDHLQAAQRPTSAKAAAPQPVPLEESLQELRKVQRWQRGGDDA